MAETLSWLTLLLLAQWFFGNLYEGVVLVPNLRSLIETKSRAGGALFETKRSSPVAYYVPVSLMMVPLIITLTIRAWLDHRPGLPYITFACLPLALGLALTVYIVRAISLPLFFHAQLDLTQTEKLLKRWKALNCVRLLLAGSSLLAVILWTRTIVRT